MVYAGALGAGYVMSWLRVPMPWMIGPMVLAGVFGTVGRSVNPPIITRAVGQTVVAGVVGLSFTPSSLAAVAEQIVPMVAVAVMTIVAGFVVAAVLMRLSRIDVVSASIASIPAGPVEMAALAVQHGVAPGPVAFAQTLRISLLVLILPPVLVTIDKGFADPALVLTGGDGSPLGAALLISIAAAGGILFRYVRISNAFFLGPLSLTAIASALALPVSAPPDWVMAGAQILLGVWLGSMFDREMLSRSPGFVPAACMSTALLLGLSVVMAFVVSALTGIDWRTMVLATAPGSVTEMALTAKILQQDVALVTAFHVIRIFIIIPAAPLIFAVTARLANRSSGGDEDG